MFISIEGIYQSGKIELSERPEGITESRVLVTFLDKPLESAPQYMRRGMLLGLKETTEEDFKAAEWHGEPEFWGAD